MKTLTREELCTRYLILFPETNKWEIFVLLMKNVTSTFVNFFFPDGNNMKHISRPWSQNTPSYVVSTSNVDFI